LLSIRSRRVKSTTSCGLDVTPALFRPTQSPLAAYHLRQAPTSIGAAPLLEHLYDRLGQAVLSSAFADSRAVFFALRHPSVDVGLTTLLFDCSEPVSPDRVLGMHATPHPPGGQGPPGRHHPAPGSHCRARSEKRAFRLNAEDFPRARISVSIVRLSTSRFSGPRGPCDEFGLIPSRIPRSACYPC